MSKELKALKRIRKARYFVDYELDANVGEDYKEELDIIETALKRLEQQDSVLKTLKEVIKFSQTMPRVEPNEHNGFSIISAISIKVQRDIENKERELLRQWVLKTCFPKELKALEIIKKCCLVSAYPNDTYELAFTNKIEITQEEYDLLKEVLL